MTDSPPAISTSTGLGGSSERLEWGFLQCFGERTPGEEIQEADIISAVEFDGTGQHLATGDRGGRVVVFERVAAQPRVPGIDSSQSPNSAARICPFEYRYLTEFQSHEPEFDYLKSLEIEEKINKVRWCNPSGGSRMLLSTNDKTIKLWKVFEKKVSCLTEFNLENQSSWSIPAGGAQIVPNGLMSPTRNRLAAATDKKLQFPLRFPKVASVEVVLAARCRRTYSNAHTYHINSVSMSSDQETFISVDDLRINLWHLDCNNQSFNIVDMKPPNMDDLTEVITCAEFHPHHCNMFAYSSSKGCIRLADMRQAALCDRHLKAFEEPESQAARNFFSEIISSISDVRFSRDGRYMLSRDFMTLKLWDINMESTPVATYPVHESLRSRLCDLYENDCIFDKFDCALSGKGNHFATGTYSNFFRVLDKQQGSGDVLLEASRDPLRKRLQNPPRTPNRFGLSRGSNRRAGAASSSPEDVLHQDLGSKMLHLAWHPESNVIATAASNSLYMFAAK
ncbi:hypothetical protein WJX84_007852 [Apatococcus fuscideae]|uniref:Serine/threonine-protein phosphatase 2A 55 kDa regulatory subunit B n=1 Tax=Apatococcus fuscideae TaxID=2026836 RepID=A0AAW1T7V2_9CHLO